METLNLKGLKLTADESKDIIRFIAKKRSTNSKKILENINLNKKTNRNTTKTNKNTTKTNKNTTKTKTITKITPRTNRKASKTNRKKKKN